MTDWMEAARQAAEILGPEVVKTGARWTGRQILDTPAERGMRRVYERAIADLLAEIGGADESTGAAPDPDAMRVAESVLGKLCSDEEAAGLLVDVALRPSPVPVVALHERAVALGCDPGTLPFAFDGAMRVLVDKVWEEFLEEAGKENNELQSLVNVELLASVRDHHRELRAASSAESGSLLPPPPGLVLGRTDEIQRAKQALGVGCLGETPVGDGVAASVRRTAAVHGWPGVGKSTFVAALCGDREVREHFSGGVLFVPVGPSPEVRRLAEEVCAALGMPAPPGATFDALRGRIAEALSRKQTLLVFDDVWEERHVAPLLLAGGASAALVATRRLDIAARVSTRPEGALRLGLLSNDDSLELIRSRAPTVVAENEATCRELAEILDGLPLALRVAADLLRVEAESGFDVSDLLVELGEAARLLNEDAPYEALGAGEDNDRVATSVRILIQKSIEKLDEGLVKCFSRLGVFPSKPLSFDQWVAEDVWRDIPELPDPYDGVTEEERIRAREALSELARRGLIESATFGVNPLAVRLDLRSNKAERFWMHALVSAFALETLERTEGEGGVREAHQRFLEHYRWVVAAANVATLEGGHGQYFGVLLMTLDLPNIRAAHGWAHAHSSEDRRALEYLSRLPAEGHRMLFERLAPDEFVEWMNLAEEAAKKTGDAEAARSHRATVGAALLKMGQLRKAKAYNEESLDDARHNEDHVGEATALANLASVRNAMGQHEAALSLARQAEEAARNADAPDIEIAAGILIATLGQQAKAFWGLGRIPEAEECHETRRDLAWERGEHSQYARALMGIAEIKWERPEEGDEAREIYAKAAWVFRDLEDHAGYCGAQNGLGTLERKVGALGEAEEAFKRALNSAVKNEDDSEQARAKMNLGIVHQNRETRKGCEAAEVEYREALPLALGEPELLGDVRFNLAQLLFYLMARPRDALTEAGSATEAYGRSGSEKESWARDLVAEIDNAIG